MAKVARAGAAACPGMGTVTRCQNPTDQYHPCVFRVDVHDDFESSCDCCEVCEAECAQEI